MTGLFGVGGGFLVIPALTLAMGLDMNEAFGTSLLVVVINSAFSTATRADHLSLDWQVIIPFTLAAVAGSLAGQLAADHLKNLTLRRVFGVLLIALACFISIESALQMTQVTR